ncbi:acyltransferase [Mucilaginibacter pallidiroseus]|uniref:Acyltransferase n=1 Tax=Mucilaginibacter pallidiroseus TaxID=2599295 RepID=A0A563UEW3_9SPHI|nr:acyltransferase [Mucilaginibacter pallidiroseus]TWR29915.1 acyltransferase [Mucilaginibacter pallidiroseus]
MEKVNPAFLKTRQHFEILDGLRGIAALAVVTFHFMEVAYTDYSKDFIAHGFLAVDFFFCLSGFVIAYAYDGRIEKISTWEFFKFRLIRLHPLVILGTVLGLLAFMFDPFTDGAQAYSAGKLAIVIICSLLMIPVPNMPERVFNLFGLNAPAWSLFWEYVFNILYAIVLYKLARKWLWALLGIAALLISWVALRADNLMGGWNGDTFWDGGVRIFYSFTAGMLVYRSNLIIKNKLGFLGVAALLMLAFLMPFGKCNWLTEPLVVMIYFPLIVALGAGTTLLNGMQKLCVFLGELSYPLYMTHYAVIWMFAGYYTAHKPDTLHLTGIIIGGLIVLPLFAWLVMKLYDKPLRGYLNSKRK